MGFFRGQGATEYLVLLAVVLVVALVSVALLGFFPGMASDARMTQSQTYWRGQARPFAMLDNKCDGAGQYCSLIMQNMEANGPYTVTSLNVGGCTANASSVQFAAGEIKTLSIGTCTAGTPGALYDLSLNLTYTTPNGITGVKEYGAKNMIGKYA